MEDLINQLYNFLGEFGKPNSPFFVYCYIYFLINGFIIGYLGITI